VNSVRIECCYGFSSSFSWRENGGIDRQLNLLLCITQQPLGENCLDFPFSSSRQHVVIVDIFVSFIDLLLNWYNKKQSKQIYTCVAFELIQLILHLIYPYSTKDDPFKFERNLHLDNGCSWLCIIILLVPLFVIHTLTYEVAYKCFIIMETQLKEHLIFIEAFL